MLLTSGRKLSVSILMVSLFFQGSAFANSFQQQNIPILLYHHIGVLPYHMSKAMRRWSLSTEQFESQMQWVKDHGFQTITMEQLVGHIKHGRGLLPKPIVLTFDDGLKDHYAVVFPILKKYHFVGTFFIITDSVGHSAYLNWKKILEMSNAGMDIEAHTLTHPNLSMVSNEQLKQEIVGSKRILEHHLNKPVTVLAYPYGCYNDEVIAMTKAAGFEGAARVSGINDGYLYRADQSYTLERYAIEGGESLAYLAHLKGFDSTSVMPAPALFVSVVQDPPVLSSREAIVHLIDFAKQAGIKTLFVQIYQAGEAWFPSKIVDDSPYQEAKKSLSEDPFALLIKEAHAQHIQVHAWLNLMSLGNNTHAAFLKKYGTGILTRNLEKKTKIEDFKIDGQYFLEPGDPRVGDDLAKMVGEILSEYPHLDGIQFDYIRYPDLNPHYGYTKSNMERFEKFAGVKAIDENSELWKDWKRAQVTRIVTRLARLARSMCPHLQISTTGCMPYARAYDEAYQDWANWISKKIVNFVTIMDYSTDPKQFNRWISVVKEKTGGLSQVKIGIGAYKMLDLPDVFKEEFQDCEEMGASCAVFHYGSILKSKELRSFFAQVSGKNSVILSPEGTKDLKVQ